MDERSQMFKAKIRSATQEVILPDFPDDDSTVTTTVTKSRRVSFGTNFIKEFIVGSAVSAQCASEYEQAFSSSDSSNANSSHSVVESEISNQKTYVLEESLKINQMLPEVEESRIKRPKISSTICFSADSPTADMEFTEGCISLAKSILDKKNKEMTVIIQAKPKESKEEMKTTKFDDETKYFEGSQFDMSMTKCFKSKENKMEERKEKRIENEKTKIFNNYDDEMSITRCDKIFKLRQSKISIDDESDGSWTEDESKENKMPLDMIMRHLDKDNSDVEKFLFHPEKSLSDVLNANPFNSSNESEKLNLNESMDISRDAQGGFFKIPEPETPKVGREESDGGKHRRLSSTNELVQQVLIRDEVFVQKDMSTEERVVEKDEDSFLEGLSTGMNLEKENQEDVEMEISMQEEVQHPQETTDNTNRSETFPSAETNECKSQSPQHVVDASSGFTISEVFPSSSPGKIESEIFPASIPEKLIEPEGLSSRTFEKVIEPEGLSSQTFEKVIEPEGLSSRTFEKVIEPEGLSSQTFEKVIEPEGLSSQTFEKVIEPEGLSSRTFEKVIEPEGLSSQTFEKVIEPEGLPSRTFEKMELEGSCLPISEKLIEPEDLPSQTLEKIGSEVLPVPTCEKTIEPEGLSSQTFQKIIEPEGSPLPTPEKTGSEVFPVPMPEKLIEPDGLTFQTLEKSIDSEISVAATQSQKITNCSELSITKTNKSENFTPEKFTGVISPGISSPATETNDQTLENIVCAVDHLGHSFTTPEMSELEKEINASDLSDVPLTSAAEDIEREPDVSMQSEGRPLPVAEVQKPEENIINQSQEFKPSLVDTKVVENLKAQSTEPGCLWTLEDLSFPQNGIKGLLSCKFQFLESSMSVRFWLKSSEENTLDSCSSVSTSEISLNGEKQFRVPEYKVVVDIGFEKLQKQFEKERKSVKAIRHIPYFLDQLSFFISKISPYLQQIYSILTLYPGSRFEGSVLSFRLYSFPILFSCTVFIDLQDFNRLSKKSLSFDMHFGEFDKNKISEIFEETLKVKNSLCEFIIRCTKFIIDNEKETGYVSKRKHIRLLPADFDV